MAGKYKTLFNNTIIFAIGTVGSKLVTFLLVPLYTNILTREEYGTADFVMTISYLVVPLISLVIQDAVLRFGLEHSDKGKVAINAVIVYIFGCVLTLAMIPLISLYEPLKEWKWYLFALIISNNAWNILSVYAKVKDQNKLYAISSIVNALVLACVNLILLLWLHLGVKGYLIANILANVIPVIVLFFFTKMYKDIHNAHYDKNLMKNMLKYSIPLIANNLSWWVLNSSDRVMIEHILSPSDLGLYTAASKIPALLSIVTTIFANAWTISSIKDYDSDKDKQFYSNVFCAFSMVMHIGAALIILIIKPFMKIYVGPDFYSSWILVPLLVLGAVYYAYSSFFGAIYGAVKKNVMTTITTMVAAIFNIGVNFLLLSKIGVLAAAISTAVGYAVIGFFRMFNSRKYFSFPIKYVKVFLNSAILITQTVLVTLNINIYIVSSISIVLLIVLNVKDMLIFFNMIKSKFFKKEKNNEGN